jgi:hypothetical protein
MKYRNVGNHAEDLADGTMVAPGEFVELNEEQVREGRNEDLIATGVFLGVDEDAEHEAQLAERRTASRGKRQADAQDAARGEEG